MRIGSLFSGIGGLELGLERAGVGQVVWQCEINPFCRQVLEKHWPTVTRFTDVTQPRVWPAVDVICGGFPCQDVSSAGKRAGLAGQRSGLWHHFAAVVEQVAPSFVVVENVASGARKWLPTVRRALHMLGYRTTAYGVSAFDVGAPHFRRRVFVLARHADSERRGARGSVQLRARHEEGAHASAQRDGGRGPAPDLDSGGQPEPEGPIGEVWRWVADGGRWTVEPDVCGVAHGLPHRVDRLRALGNAVVPQCAEVIGRLILRPTHATAVAHEDKEKR